MKRFAILFLLAAIVAAVPLCALADTAYTGPVDTSEETYFGANETGSYDGVVAVSSANAFTARAIPLTNPNPAPANMGTVPGTWIGNTFSVSAAPVVDVPNMVYYSKNTNGDSINLTVTPPPGWSAQICRDAGGGSSHITTTPTSADCTAVDTGCWYPGWSKSGSGSSATLCVRKYTTVVTVYWVRYTGPISLTAFARYDAAITVSANATNSTHNELYAGFVPLTKQVAVVASGCPSGALPTYPALGVCPGGIIRYTIDYRNVIAGGGLGTEGGNASAFPIAAAGTFVVTDDGTLSLSSQSTQANWASFDGGFYAALAPGLGVSGNTSCGSGSSACGDSTAGTTFLYATGVPRSAFSAAYSSAVSAFEATIGGASGSLYPNGFAHTWQGTLSFAVTVK